MITGTLKRSSDGSVVAGGYVVAIDGSGRTVGSALADDTGTFRLEGLVAGTYDVWADPLDQPVSAANLTPGHTVQTDFESKFLGQVVLALGATQSMGDQTLDGDVSISLGKVADDYPLRVISGRTVARTVRGDNLLAGSTLTTLDPTVSISSAVFNGSSVQFNVTVPAGSPDGHLDLLVTGPLGEKDLLPGALEVTPSSPEVDFCGALLGTRNRGLRGGVDRRKTSGPACGVVIGKPRVCGRGSGGDQSHQDQPDLGRNRGRFPTMWW